MLNSQNLSSGKGWFLFGSLLLLFIAAICVVFSMTGSDDFDIARREVLLRSVGNEVLLQSGDRTSRVLPVVKIAENEYQVSFEHKLTFVPDSLINTTRRLMTKDPLSADYVVNVLNTGKPGVAYGYAIAKNESNNIIACRGRKQPKGSYLINVKFKAPGITKARNRFFLGSLPFLAFVGFIFLRSVKPRGNAPGQKNTDMLSLGAILFDVKDQNLIINGTKTNLTGTESRVLHVFALSPNQIIQKNRLQKEIWEDEGVIVGRSLDMFISKLRKKLEPDPNIKIVVIRGKGYKLEIRA